MFFITEENHESERAKDVNENVVHNELKYEYTKTSSSIVCIWDMRRTEFRVKIIT